MTKARLSLFQIWNMCFGFFGIQIGFGLQNANTSRIFQTLGVEIDHLAILWIAAPATGLLVQPIIGYLSDKTWGKLGRRRPYFFWGAILTTAALILMPNSPSLWIAASALWIMDASINITMEPFRAFVGDNLPDEQRSTGYAMQSFFIGIGAVLASCLPWILTNWLDVANTAPAGQIPDSVRIAFYAGGAVLLASVLWTVFSTREYSPEQMAAFEAAEAAAKGEAVAVEAQAAGRGVAAYLTGGVAWTIAGLAVAVGVYAARLEKELYVLAALIAGFGVAQLVAGQLKAAGRTRNGFSEVVEDLFAMPSTMKQLAVVQFFSWFGLFAMWIYTTPGVAAFHYGATDTASAAYNAGADWVGVLFGVYNGVAALAALLIPVIARTTSRRVAHALCLVLGGLGLLSFLVIRDPKLLIVGMVGVGFAWSSILSAPYSILSGSVPARKMGVYMGIFNFFIVIPQLLAATVLGLLLKTFFGGQAIYALVLGAISFLIAAVAVFAVNDPGEPKRLAKSAS
ncbi:MFS transporter [Caulobacter sp. D5]|uniref:MFS transporter n=3 Tax=unclassified Caulobacter TaxID=2648921 RepID=UPI000D72991C|nr:MFS transporter [Caulobacter sp. D5]PXA93527.1 MFS transporter [Caulobacter sp. D5]